MPLEMDNILYMKGPSRNWGFVWEENHIYHGCFLAPLRKVLGVFGSIFPEHTGPDA
jgi:hypothetical protein